LQIPTGDVDASAGFYERALGWTIRTRGDGSTAFDDTTSEVSGEWVLDRQPAGDAGVLVYVRVDDVNAILQRSRRPGARSSCRPRRRARGWHMRPSSTRPGTSSGSSRKPTTPW